MMNMARVSVIMSVYKEPIEWLCQSIDSIINQTYNNFEFIIICDNPLYLEGKKLLEEYVKKDSRIVLVFNEENIGLTKSLNKGLSIAHGEYIIRMDADDVSMPNRIEKQIKFMDENPDIAASGTSAYIMRGEKLKYSRRQTSSNYLLSMCIFESPINHPSSIFRRIIDGIEIKYDEKYKYSQDYALWLSLLEKHKISNVDEPLILYRISDEQISNHSHSIQQEYAIMNQCKAIDLLGFKLNDLEILILQDITRRPQKKHETYIVRKFVIDFVSQINNRFDLEKRPLIFKLLLIYSNYLSCHERFFSALKNYSLVSIKTRHFFIYCYLSLFKKYIFKFNICSIKL